MNRRKTDEGISPWWRDPLLLGLATGALLLRLVVAWLADGLPPVNDEIDYLQLARVLVEEGQYLGTFRPPLYPFYLAVSLAAGGGTLVARLGQAVLGAALVILVYGMGRRMAGLRVARMGAALVALDPLLVFFSGFLWSETLYLFLFLTALSLITMSTAPARRWPWAFAGFLFGLAGLARAQILTFVPLLLPWALLQAARSGSENDAGQTPGEERSPLRRALIQFVLLAAGCATAVLPWTARNWLSTGALVLVDSNGAYNVLVGNQRDTAFVDKDDTWSLTWGAVEGRDYQEVVAVDPARAQQSALRRAGSEILADPGLFIRKSLWEAGHVWTLDSFMLRHMRNGWSGGIGLSGFTGRTLTILTPLFFVLLAVAGLAGLASISAGPYRGLVILLLVHGTLLFGLTFSVSRHGLPFHVFLAIPAAVALAHPRETLASLHPVRSSIRRLVALALCLLALVVTWSRDLPLLRDMLMNDGRAHRFRVVQRPDGISPSSGQEAFVDASARPGSGTPFSAAV